MILAIIGISGKMGSRVYDFYKDKYTIIGIDKIKHKEAITYSTLKELDNFDVVIDFSSPSTYDEIIYALDNNKIVLSGTTGYDLKRIEEIGIKYKNFYWSCNYAKGIPLFLEIIKRIMPNYEMFDFVEIHASTKKDSPSGTAKMIAQTMNINEKKIQSLRLEKAPAIHELVFSSNNERIILRHEIISHQAFLEGLDIKLKEMLENVKEII